jgi:hypothetical protein
VVAILVVAKLGGTSSKPNAAATDTSDPRRVPSAASSLGPVTPVVPASSSAEAARAPASADRGPPVRAKVAPWSRPRARRPRSDVPDYGI